MTTRVYLVALDGVSHSSLGIAIDTLQTANRIARALGRRTAPFRTTVCAVDGHSVRYGSGGEAPVEAALASVRPARKDVVLVPGLGLALPEELEPAMARADVHAVIRFVRRAHRAGALVCASCSATFVLGESGLLDRREATTTWWLAAAFRERYPRVLVRSDRMVVQSGRTLTAGASFAQADLSLALVAQFAGPALAELCARYLLVDGRPTQARFMIAHQLAQSDPAVAAAERFVRERLGEPLEVARIAKAAGVSPRTLARRLHAQLGLGPVRFVQRLRAEAAAELLETTTRSFDAIAAQVGYADPAALRRILQRETGRTARGLRGPRAD